MKLNFFFFNLFFLISAAYSQENYEIKEINFQGNKNISTKKLLEQLESYSLNWIEKKIMRKQPSLFSNESFDQDLKRIKIFYQKEGFPNINIQKPDFSINHQKETIEITIHIQEGKPYIVKKLIFKTDSIEPFDLEKKISISTQSIENDLNLSPGKRFRDWDFYQDQEKILNKLRNHGYPKAKVDYELKIDSVKNNVEIHWNILPGEKCYFGEIHINGNQKTSHKLIKKQLAFKKNELFRQKLITQSQQQLYELGFFHSVNIKANLQEINENRVPVTILIQEAPFFNSKTGIGYGKEDQFRVFCDVNLFNFPGEARRVDLLLKHSGLEPYYLDFKINQPRFLSLNATLSLNPYLIKQKEPGYDAIKYGTNLIFSQRLTHKFQQVLAYSLEKTQIQSKILEIDSDMAKDLYTQSHISFAMNYDRSSPKFNPQQGYFTAFESKLSGLGFKNSYHYLKINTEFRKYFNLNPLVFAAKIKIGTIHSFDASEYIPQEDRFYSGGSSSIRGWARSQLGPSDPENIPIGGKSLLEMSVELRYPIYKLFSGVLFSDFGNVWKKSLAYSLNEIRYCLGLGFRYKTPIGPARFDLAKPVLESGSKKLQIHVSVGHAF